MSEPVHLTSPFTFNNRGIASVQIQDSPEEHRTRAYNVVVCPIGFRDDLPEYGIPELLFSRVPLDVESLKTAIERWAEIEKVSASEAEEIFQSADRKVTVEVP
jgi:hypothetical protein